MKKAILFSIAIFLLAAQLFAAEGNVVVIANQGVPGSSISSGTLKLIYLGKKITWPDGSVVVPVDLTSGSAQESFLNNYVDKSPSQYSSFWKQAIFTGEGPPPRSFSSTSELVAYVAATPGAVGYVAAGSSTGGAKVLKVE
ncbi:hypothetical protein JW948_02555 [bacterium]|nr:hypothetical protein [bacterium]